MKKLHFSLFILFLPYLAFAIENLTYSQAVELIKKNNHEIQVADFNQKIQELKIQEVQAQNYGSLDFVQKAVRSNDALNVFGFKLQSKEASFRDFGFAEFDMSNPNLLHVRPNDLNHPEARSHFSTSLEYKLPLYTGGKLSQYEKMQRVLLSLSELDKQSVINQKLYEVKKSFYAVSLLETYEKNLQRIKENITVLEKTTQEMINEGYAKNIDLLEVQAKKSNIQRMLQQSKTNKSLLYHFISFLVGTEVVSIRSPDEQSYSQNISTQEVLDNNLDIKKANKAKKLSSLHVKATKASTLPQVGLFAEYGSSDDTFMNDLSEHDAYTVGVEFRWNIFDGQKSSAKMQQAQIERLKRKEQSLLAKKGIKLQVAKIKTNIANFESHIQSLQKELRLARSIYENYLGRYQENLVSINDVIVKQSDEISKVLELKELQNKKNEKLFELEKLANGEYSETIY